MATAPELLMFDLDGTLVDTMQAFADLAAAKMAALHGDDFAAARAGYLRTSGLPFVQQLEILHPGHPTNAQASREFELEKRSICERAGMSSETRKALEDLRALGVRLCVSSNTGQAFVDEFVAREGFAFDLALGFAPEAGMAKGVPHLRCACERFGIAPDRVWFVGDSLKDGELAADGEVEFVGRTGTFPRAAFVERFPGGRVIDDIAELVELVACRP